MADKSLIPDDKYARALRRCTKRIITARVMTFIFSALFFAAGFLVAYIGIYTIGWDGGFIMPTIILGDLGLLFTSLGLISLFRPFVPLLIASLISVSGLAWWITGIFDNTNIFTIGANLIALLLQVIFIWFIYRGAVYAWRKQKLNKTVE